MRVVFLLGNGFDINLGLETGYHNFYKYYLKQDVGNDTPAVQKLKAHIQENLSAPENLWSDLERGMGKYTSLLESYEEMEEVYDHLYGKMKEFVKLKNDEFDVSTVSALTFVENIAKFHKFLKKAESESLNNLFNRRGGNLEISIITFNYTDTIERMLGFQELPIDLGVSPIGSGVRAYLNNIVHVHGDYKSPILGVNDITQIENPALREDLLAQHYLVKPMINTNKGENVDLMARHLIDIASVIFIYGMSAGETDRTWWERIGNRFVNDARVIMNVYDEKMMELPPQKLGKFKLTTMRKFMELAGVPEHQQNKLSNNFFVTLNSPIFNIKS